MIRICIPHVTREIEVESDDSLLEDVIKRIYQPYVVGDAKEKESVLKVYISIKESYMLIKNGNRSKRMDIKNESVISNICGFIQLAQKSVMPWNLYHGAAMCIKGKTVVFLGASGTGKTTLIAYLSKMIEESYYIAEDVLIINCKENCIYPYPRPLHLRKGGKELLEETYNIDLGVEVEEYFGEYQRYILDLRAAASREYSVDYYINLIRDENAAESIWSRVETKKYETLLYSSYLSGNIMNNLICSDQLADRAVVYEVRYSNLELLKKALINMLSQ